MWRTARTVDRTPLLIIDDHDDVRGVLESQLNGAPDFEVVASIGCWESGLRRALESEPEVVLLETKRADGGGLEALQSFTDRGSSAAVVVLTSYLDAEERAAASSMGAAGYLLKDIDTTRLVSEIRLASR